MVVSTVPHESTDGRKAFLSDRQRSEGESLPRQKRRRRTVVTEQTKRRWLSLHDGGVSFSQIANNDKADRRTVEKHVLAAQEERHWGQVRGEVHRTELMKHFERIRAAAAGLGQSVRLPGYATEHAWAWPDDPEGLPLDDVIRSHFPATWSLLADWERVHKAYVASYERLRERAGREANERGWGGDAVLGLLHQTVARTQGSEGPETAAYPVLPQVDWTPAVESILNAEEALQVQRQWSRLRELHEQLDDALTEARFKVRVPGECRFCKA